MKKILMILILFLFFSSVALILVKQKKSGKVSGQIKTEKADPAYGDAIIVGSIGDASNLLPPLASDSASFDIIGLVYNGIVKYDENLNLTGDLAESWDISRDCRTVVFHLRKGVRWHDGAEFTAYDVEFGYKTIVNPKTPTAYSSSFEEVKNVEVTDKHTLKVVYRKPFAPGLSTWSNLVVLPKHLLEGKDITKSGLFRHPVGTGPYKFKEWTPGQKIVLEANPDYFEKGKPYIQRYIYRIIPDQSTMFLELRGGNIDETSLTPIQFRRQTDTPYFADNFKKYNYLSFGYTYLGYNLKKEIFKDKRVRQAISYGINKKEIIDGVLLGLASPASAPYKPDTWVYNPGIKKYDYNPVKAKELLQDAGWADTDGDGFMDKNGKKFEFYVTTNQGNDQRLKTAELVQRNLGEIGIKMNIKVLEWTAFLDAIDRRNFDAVIIGWSLDPDPDQYDIWHSSRTGPKEFNFVSYENPEVDRLLEAGRNACSIDKRKGYYFKLQEILAEDQPYTFLYFPQSLPIVHSRFYGIKPAPAGIGYNFVDWFVPQQMQKYYF
ncbi:MAG TPA: peptide-binding protein [bacterium]